MSTLHGPRKLAARKSARTPTDQNPRKECVGTLPVVPNVQNTFTSSAPPCPVNLVSASNTPPMKYGTLIEQLETWVKDLLDSERDFLNMVAMLNATDRMVFQNISRLECLHQILVKLGESQAEVCSDLSRIGCCLHLMEEVVKNLENQQDGKQSCLPEKQSNASSCAEENMRTNLYNFMVQLNKDLNFTMGKLSEVIQAVNKPNGSVDSGTNPVQQIGCILNYHYECLVDIDDAHMKCKSNLENLQQIQKRIIESSSKC